MKMPDEDEKPSDDKSKGTPTTSRSQTRSARDYFRIPPLIKRVFDEFPLVTYEANELPIRATKLGTQHALYIFATEEGARDGRPSFNPACLRWQVCGPTGATHRDASLTTPRHISDSLASIFEPSRRTIMLHQVEHCPSSFPSKQDRKLANLSHRTSFRSGGGSTVASPQRSLQICVTKRSRL